MTSKKKGLGDDRFITLPVPPELFTEIIPAVADLDELKALFCALPLLNPQKNAAKYFFLDDLLEAESTLANFSKDDGRLVSALTKACSDEILLLGEYDGRKVYFLNTPQSKAALRALQKTVWAPDQRQPLPGNTTGEKPNVFTLYQKNIGPLTPILAETLEDAEKEYPAEWLEEAVKIAVKKNVRNWQYIEAILRSWKEKGRGEKDQRNNEKDARKYIEGDLADYIKH